MSFKQMTSLLHLYIDKHVTQSHLQTPNSVLKISFLEIVSTLSNNRLTCFFLHQPKVKVI